MSWLLAGVYCFGLWLVFAKLRLLRLSLPLAILAAAVGPLLIVALLFCAQFFHPFTYEARVFQEVVPITPQLRQQGRVVEVPVEPNTPLKKGDVLFKVDPVPYQNSVDRLTAALEQAKQSVLVAEASVEVARAALQRAESNLEFATRDRDRNAKLVESNAVSKEEYDEAVNRFVEADASVRQNTASLSQAQLSIAVAKTQVEQTQMQLADAEYDLEQTTIVAPGDGYVTNLQLRLGMLVGGASTSGVMSFVLNQSERSRGVVVAAFNQKNFLRIKPGQYAEVALHGYPGEIFTARVLNAIDISGSGQLTADGKLPDDLGPAGSSTFAVRVQIDNSDKLRIPGGSQADVAIYTEDIQIAGIPVMFLIRAQSWIRFVR